MNNTMKKILVLAAVAAMGVGTCQARPHGGPGRHGGGPRPASVVHRVHGGHYGGHGYHHGGVWGRGGRNFWPGLVGGIIGGALLPPPPLLVPPVPVPVVVHRPVVAAPAPVVVQPAPVVVQQPVVQQQPVVVQQPVVQQPVVQQPAYTTQNVWVEGRYVDQVQANGTVVRVWQPGHYEQRQVLVQ